MGSYSNPTDKPTSHSVTHIWTFLRLSEVHWIKVISMMTSIILLVTSLALANAGDINRQSIIFNENTPDVFYCPQEKPISIDRMLVKSKPMKKLCEYEGRGLPENVKSDCWNDVDETEYACSEKKRIMLRMNPPGHENAIIDNYVPIYRPGEYKIRKTEDLDLSKILWGTAPDYSD